MNRKPSPGMAGAFLPGHHFRGRRAAAGPKRGSYDSTRSGLPDGVMQKPGGSRARENKLLPGPLPIAGFALFLREPRFKGGADQARA